MNAFLRVNVTFYDAVNIIHDVISKPNPFPYTAKFMFVGVRNNKTQQNRHCKINRIRILVSPRLENYQFSQPR